MNLKQSSTHKKSKEWMKVALYTGALAAFYTTASYASFETQIPKISKIVFDNLAPITVGGGVIMGGGIAAKDGNLPKAGGVICVSFLLGIAIALIKNGTMFSSLA